MIRVPAEKGRARDARLGGLCCAAPAGAMRGPTLRASLIALLCFSLASCAVGNNPRNAATPMFSREIAAPAKDYAGQLGGAEPGVNQRYCPEAGAADFILAAPKRKPLNLEQSMRYSPGDRFNISAPGLEDFSGDYMINADGRVILPFATEVRAVGLSNAELNRRIEEAYVRADIFKPGAMRLALRPRQFGPINIFVAGAVFSPGRTTINNVKDSDKGETAIGKFGDAPLDRFVPSALRAAGGVRPDADVSKIELIRGEQHFFLDWRGAFTGEAIDDAPLVDGDKIVVHEAPCFQSGLVRVTQITPPGIRIFQSNLTLPASNNGASGIGQFSGSVPYGTRFLQGLVASNCVGGNLASNAARQAVLISRNPKTMRTEVTQRSIEELVRSADRDAINPFLMPDDAIACYDSTVTEVRDLFSNLQQLVSTAQTGRFVVLGGQ